MPAEYSFVSIYTSVMCLGTVLMARDIRTHYNPVTLRSLWSRKEN